MCPRSFLTGVYTGGHRYRLSRNRHAKRPLLPLPNLLRRFTPTQLGVDGFLRQLQAVSSAPRETAEVRAKGEAAEVCPTEAAAGLRAAVLEGTSHATSFDSRLGD